MSSVVGGDFDAALCFVDDFMSDGAYGEASPLGLDELSEIPLTQPLSIDMATDQLDQARTVQGIRIDASCSIYEIKWQIWRKLIMCAWQKTRRAVISAAGNGMSNAKGGDIEEATQAVWKDMAISQLEQRLRSERHNRRLKSAVENQLKIAKRLERLLEAHITTNAIETCLHGGQRLKRVQQLTPDQSDMYIGKELMASIDSVYRDVDAVIHDNNLDTLESSFDDSEINEGSDGIYMNVIASTVFPFDVASTGAAAWQYFSRSLDHMPFLFLNH
ncbi:hypothetical protein F443_13273 [Phytophthora nicotianae P1569]|uniref:Uncharacterized protein n=2 Tax=Phytophthora nicotianae TaxID=4792 RepID=V9ETW1_PHYNI|nr:hypothetical protein F443_13273 [Phytophthora nicotianae P1569]ETO70148.1 hypothetical protein F444_13350 [Phytophthora nicotianae P1976]